MTFLRRLYDIFVSTGFFCLSFWCIILQPNDENVDASSVWIVLITLLIDALNFLWNSPNFLKIRFNCFNVIWIPWYTQIKTKNFFCVWKSAMEIMCDNLFSAGVLHLYWITDAITFWKEVYIEKTHQ